MKAWRGAAQLYLGRNRVDARGDIQRRIQRKGNNLFQGNLSLELQTFQASVARRQRACQRSLHAIFN